MQFIGIADERPGFLQMVVMVELVWVLETGYARNRSQVVHILEQLLRTRTLLIERADLVSQATGTYASTRADFADCLIERVSIASGCEQTLTFDRIAARDTGMKLLDWSFRIEAEH